MQNSKEQIANSKVKLQLSLSSFAHCSLLIAHCSLLIAICSGCQAGSDAPIPVPPGPHIPAEISIPYDLHPLRTAVPADFIRGADISNCYEIEQHDGAYRNFEDEVEDIMDILADGGINYVRVRLWIDPDKNPQHYAGDGNNNMTVTKAIAVRAKAAGMKFMLDCHYSDWWANPSTQQIPYLWKDIPTKQGFLDALHTYTKETIEELTEAGAAPDMVKIGNEITDGLLSQHAGASSDGTGYVLNGWADYSDALQYAARAVREAAPNAKIAVHFGDGGVGGLVNIYANFTRRVNGPVPAYAEVDYDTIGLSWYPIWQQHLSIDSLYSNIVNLKQTFGKDVVICETGYMWTLKNYDSFGNYVGAGNEEVAANSLTNINGFASDSGIEFPCREDGTTRYVPSNPENQARVIRAIMDAVVSAGGMGVTWWGADWIAPVRGLRSNAEMGALFDNEGGALPAIKVMGSISGADAAKPGKVTGVKAAATGDTVTLTWDTAHSAIASKYKIERAIAADGPWTSVSDNLTGYTYSDMGLAHKTAYYYRLCAWNKNGWGNYSGPLETRTAVFTAQAPAGLRVTGNAANSVTLTWNAVTGAASYKLYGAQSASAPAASAFALLADVSSGTAYTHGGLTNGNTWWYKVSAVSVNHGEGPQSSAVNVVVGVEIDFKASINMSTAVLDADFLDALKASSSTN